MEYYADKSDREWQTSTRILTFHSIHMLIKIHITTKHNLIAKPNFEHNSLNFRAVLKNIKSNFKKHNWLKPTYIVT